MKIDVEGFEHQVLLWSRGVLSMRPRPEWMIEVCLPEYHPGLNLRYGETFGVFFEGGYSAFTADVCRYPIFPADIERHVKSGRSDSGTINYLFTDLSAHP